MGHKSFAIALVLGLAALPLACSGDDDDVANTGGTGGSGGKAGSSGTSGSAGKGGTGGKGGTTSTSGSSAGGEGGSGTSGTANTGGTGNTSGTGNTGVGGEGGEGATGPSLGGAGGEGVGGEAGSGGEGGSGTDPLLAIIEGKLHTVCQFEVIPTATEGDPTSQCDAHEDANCTDVFMEDVTAMSASCRETYNEAMDCVLDPAASQYQIDLYCGNGTSASGTVGKIGYDIVLADQCFDVWNDWASCQDSL